MNYAKSKEKIIPVTNDTPCLLQDLRDRLAARTSYDIPFFLMPVRTETRFMKDQSSHFLDSDCLLGPFVIEFGGRMGSLSDVVRKYGSYMAFTSDTAFAAGLEINTSIKDIESGLPKTLIINEAEQYGLRRAVTDFFVYFRKTYDWLLHNCPDPVLQPTLKEVLDDTVGRADGMLSRFAAATIDADWQGNVSADIKAEWSKLAAILTDNAVIIATYIVAGELNEEEFIRLLNSSYKVAKIFKVNASNEFDKLFVWLQLSTLDKQFKAIYGDLQSIGAEREIRWLYKVTTALDEKWRLFALPEIPLQVLKPVPNALNITIDESDVSDEIKVLKKFISARINEGDKIVDDIKAISAEIVLIQYDSDEKTNGGNILAGSQIEKMCVALQQYSDNLGEIEYALKEVDLSDETDLAYVWQGVHGLNRQISVVNTGINVLPSGPVIDIGNPYDPGDPTGPGDPPIDPFASDSTSTANPIRIIDEIKDHVIDIRTGFSDTDDYTVLPWFTPETILDELWIRVYPDDISINSVETEISLVEAYAGEIYWYEAVLAFGERSLTEGAWRTLAATHGAERAAFIKQTMTPENIDELAGLNNPYYKIVDHVNLLTEYTGRLLEFANKNATLQINDIEFYIPQLDSLNKQLLPIEVLPEDALQQLNDTVGQLADKFSEIIKLKKIILQIPGEESIVSAFKIIDSVGNRFAVLSETLSLITTAASWSDIYTATPVFGTVTTVSNSSWSQPATSKVMPDRFLFAAVNNATKNIADTVNFGSHSFRHIAIGRQIPDTLKTGIDPQSPGFSYDATNDIIFDPDLKWIVDFRSALDKGMAKAIKMVGTEMTDGFDKIIVLGVKLYEGKTHTGTWQDFLKNTGKSQLEDLFFNHQYTKGGMSFVQIGTPTNNTDDAASGYNARSAENDLSFSTTSGAPLFTPQVPILQKTDGQRLADAIGINYSAFQHVQNSDKYQISNAININRSLWGGTIGNYMKEMMNFLFTDDNILRTKEYFTDYVLARSILPSLRIKNQPYGILPVTSFGRWDWKLKYDQNIPFPDGLTYSSDGIVPPVIGTYSTRDYASDGGAGMLPGVGSANINDFLQDRFNLRLNSAFEELNKTWLEISAWHTKTVERSQGTGTAQSDFMHMLGHDATMAESESRYFVNNAGFINNFPSISPDTFTLHRLGHSGPNPMWASPPVPAGYHTIPDYFKSLFDNFQFPLNPITAPPAHHPLGDSNGLFDTNDFMDYESAQATAGHPLFSPPVPRYDWILNALRIFNVNFIDSPLPYKLTGPTVSEMPLSATGFLPSTNYISWLNSPSTSLTNIWNNNSFGTMPSRSLLYLLLRQSVLITYRDASFDVMEGFLGGKHPIFSKGIRKVMGSPEGIMLQQSISDPYPHDPNWKKQPINKWYFVFNSIKTIADPSSPLNAGSSVLAEKRLYDTFANFNAFSVGYGSLGALTSGSAGSNSSNDYKNIFNLAYGYADSFPGLPFDPLIIPNIITTGGPSLYPGSFTALSGVFGPGVVFPTDWSTDTSADSWLNTVLGDYLKRNPAAWTNADINALAPTQSLKDYKNSLTRLSTIPTAELDQLLREHIDLCTYRLDAWSLGMVNKRLLEIRNTDNKDTAPTPAARKTGIYLGAYGWVLNVRPVLPGSTTVVANADIPASLSTPNSVYFNQNNLGFVHTPSLTHALTAAVLRSGYKSEISAADNRFAVNLSSERVNLATSLLEGIRNGQTLNALLGYIFEKNLHDRYTAPTYAGMDAILNKLRKRLPLSNALNIENNNHVLDPLDNTSPPATNIRAYDVVDGVALLEVFKNRFDRISNENPTKSIYDIYSSTIVAPLLTDGTGYSCVNAYNLIQNTDLLLEGTYFLPIWSTSSPIVAAIFIEVDRIANAIDALGDVLTSEGVFQAAKGNLARSAATLEALTEGKNPTSPQIIDTPVNSIKVNHKLAALIEPFDSTIVRIPADDLPSWWYVSPPVSSTIGSPYTYNVWHYVTPSNRSIAEPNLNNWVGKLLGVQLTGSGTVIFDHYPEHIACVTSYQSSPGVTTSFQVTLSDLDLQPLDLLHMVRAGSFTSEMKSRICFFVRKMQNLATTVAIKVDYDDKGTATGAFGQILAPLSAIADTIANSRWMKSADFVDSASVATSGSPAYNLVEYANRYNTLLNQVTTLQTYFTSIPLSFPDDGAVNDFRNHLFKAAYLGIEYAIPDSAIEHYTDMPMVNNLIGIARNIYGELTKRRSMADAFVPTTGFPPGTTEEQEVKAHSNAIGALLGNGFKAIPQFSFDNYTGLQTSIYDQLDAQAASVPPTTPPDGNIMANYFGVIDDAMDEWIYGMARVKERIDSVETIRLFAREGNAHPLETIRPVQFPNALTDYWLGLEYPSTYKPTSDKFSVGIFNSDLLHTLPAAPYYCGLIIEEWSEEIPFSEQTTGLTFNYSQPTAKPPQNVLLAINPKTIQTNSIDDTATSKQWEIEDLLHTLLDTIDMAQIRMVEPDDFLKISSPPSTVTSPYYTGSVPSDFELKTTGKFDIFKWILPAIVGEVTPKDAAGNYQGAGSVQGVSFDYYANSASPPVAPPSGTGSGTGTGASGTAGGSTSVPIGISLPGTTYSGPVISDWGVLHDADSSSAAVAMGIPAVGGLGSAEYVVNNAEAQEFIERQTILSDITGLQNRLSGLVESIQKDK